MIAVPVTVRSRGDKFVCVLGVETIKERASQTSVWGNLKDCNQFAKPGRAPDNKTAAAPAQTLGKRTSGNGGAK
jgi:hypothetical protein